MHIDIDYGEKNLQRTQDCPRPAIARGRADIAQRAVELLDRVWGETRAALMAEIELARDRETENER